MTWWEKPLRIVNFNYFYVDSGNKLTDADFVKMAEIRKNWHVNTELIMAVHSVRLKDKVPFNSAFFEKLSNLGDRDLLRDYIPEAHKRGIKVIACICTHWYSREFGQQHPDWEQVKANGTPISATGLLYGGGTSFCPNSPWRDWSYSLIQEVGKYDVDGIFLDGPVFYPDYCYCEHCHRKFKENYGRDLPAEEDWSSALWKDFVEFRQQSMDDYLRDARAALKSVNPEAIIYLNTGSWRGNQWRVPRDVQRLGQYQDMNGAEAYYGYGGEVLLWYPASVAKYLAGVGKPTICYFDISPKPWEYVIDTVPEITLRIAQAVANGSNPQVWLFEYSLQHNPKGLDRVMQMYKFLEENEEYYESTQSEANVALLFSRQTADCYVSRLRGVYKDVGTGEEKDLIFDTGTGEAKVDWKAKKRMSEEKVIPSFLGFFEILMRAHIPFDVILDTNVTPENLAKYDVLILPNSACLNEGQVETIKGFVREGGGLVATFESSLYDGRGEERENFALGDLFGVQPGGGMMEPSTIDYMAVKGGHPIVEGFESGQIIPRPTLLMKVSCNGRGVELVRALEPLDQIYTRLKGESEFPAIVASEVGKGRVVYFACSIGSDYHTYKLAQYGKLAENAARWSSKGKIPIEVEAPGSVEVELRGQPEHNRLLIHLVSNTGEMKRPIERIIPIRDVKVKLMREGAKRVYSLTTQKDLEFEAKSEWIEFVIPQIEIYEVIVVET